VRGATGGHFPDGVADKDPNIITATAGNIANIAILLSFFIIVKFFKGLIII
jgi:hypothetical protein